MKALCPGWKLCCGRHMNANVQHTYIQRSLRHFLFPVPVNEIETGWRALESLSVWFLSHIICRLFGEKWEAFEWENYSNGIGNLVRFSTLTTYNYCFTFFALIMDVWIWLLTLWSMDSADTNFHVYKGFLKNYKQVLETHLRCLLNHYVFFLNGIHYITKCVPQQLWSLCNKFVHTCETPQKAKKKKKFSFL